MAGSVAVEAVQRGRTAGAATAGGSATGGLVRAGGQSLAWSSAHAATADLLPQQSRASGLLLLAGAEATRAELRIHC
eukprot:COSAG05_NODE_14315_length_400_cov_1.508306_2_plen_76_part_01